MKFSFMQKLDLSGCPQITFAVLLLSMLPYSYDLDPKIKNRIKRSLSNLTTDIPISKGLLPTLSFEAVCEVDISNCQSLNLEAAIECFSKSFPSLRIVKAAHCWNFKTKALSQLVHKCPLVLEVDITVDISPVIPAQVSIMTSSSLISPQLLLENEFTVLEDCLAGRLPSPSSITKLTLEGRTDFSGEIHKTRFCLIRRLLYDLETAFLGLHVTSFFPPFFLFLFLFFL